MEWRCPPECTALVGALVVIAARHRQRCLRGGTRTNVGDSSGLNLGVELGQRTVRVWSSLSTDSQQSALRTALERHEADFKKCAAELQQKLDRLPDEQSCAGATSGATRAALDLRTRTISSMEQLQRDWDANMRLLRRLLVPFVPDDEQIEPLLGHGNGERGAGGNGEEDGEDGLPDAESRRRRKQQAIALAKLARVARFRLYVHARYDDPAELLFHIARDWAVDEGRNPSADAAGADTGTSAGGSAGAGTRDTYHALRDAAYGRVLREVAQRKNKNRPAWDSNPQPQH